VNPYIGNPYIGNPYIGILPIPRKSFLLLRISFSFWEMTDAGTPHPLPPTYPCSNHPWPLMGKYMHFFIKSRSKCFTNKIQTDMNLGAAGQPEGQKSTLIFPARPRSALVSARLGSARLGSARLGSAQKYFLQPTHFPEDPKPPGTNHGSDGNGGEIGRSRFGRAPGIRFCLRDSRTLAVNPVCSYIYIGHVIHTRFTIHDSPRPPALSKIAAGGGGLTNVWGSQGGAALTYRRPYV